MTKPNALVQVGHEHLPAPVERPDADPLTSPAAYRHALELAHTLSQSQLIPKNFQGKPADVFMAMLLARRMGEDVFTVLNNVHFVGNKPGWSASFMIARANQSGIFSTPLTWETTGAGEDLAVTCSATLAKTGQVVRRTASMRMARAEQWTKNPKYNLQGLAEQMLAYRSSTLLLRLYAPQILLGLHTDDEWEDVAASRGQSITYEEPEHIVPSSPPAPARRSISAAQTLPGGEGRAPEAISLPVAASSGEDSSAHSAEALGSSPSTPAPSPSASSQAVSPPLETQPAAQGADLGDERAAVLAEVAALREECPLLLREQAQAMGLKTPSRAPTAKLRELVAITRGRRPLVGLSDAELLERIGAAWGNVADHDWALTLAEVAGLPISDKGPVLDGAPRPMLERYLVTLLLAVEQQQTQRQDTAVREALLTQAREVLREMSSEAAGEVFERLGVLTLEDCSEAQLRELIGGGA